MTESDSSGIVRASLSDQAYKLLAEGIVSGRFASGERLTEEALCARFGISRTPVRDALARLRSEGMVEPLPKRGIRVCELDRNAVRELFECRVFFETAALERALGKIPDSEWETLEKTLESDPSKEASLACDERIHGLFAEYCGNRWLAASVRDLIGRTGVFRTVRGGEPRQRTDINRERLELIRAIRKNDFPRAKTILREHIMHGIPEKK